MRGHLSDPPVGILNVNKPAGITSFDVVARVRTATAVRRVGHAGTLDPLASGVLLVAVGRATRIIPYLQTPQKVYRAEMTLGIRTTTYDSEGEVVERLAVPDHLDLSPFVGDVWQTPPLYSALKKDGKALYRYARAGQTVDVEPRLVRIDAIEQIAWRAPVAELRITCGKGTYVRSLAHDLGGHLTGLVREAVGGFTLESAITLDQLPAWENYLVPIPAALENLPRLVVDTSDAARLTHGLPVAAPSGEALALDSEGEAIAIVRDGHPAVVFGTG